MSVSCECCVFSVEASASGWSVVQRSTTDCGVSECDHESSTVIRPWPSSTVEKKLHRNYPARYVSVDIRLLLNELCEEFRRRILYVVCVE
jgi:hypothetical protein